MIVESIFAVSFILMVIAIELKDPSYSFLSFGLAQAFIGIGFIAQGRF